MKKYGWLTILMALVLMLGSFTAAHAEIIPPRGEGQIGLSAAILCEELSVRQAPSGSAQKVTTARYGDILIVMSVSDGWAYCALGDSEDSPMGWVNMDYIAIDPAMFGDPKEIEEHLSTFLQELRDSPKAEGHDHIYTHGEKAALATARAKEEGVPVDVKTVIEMKDMADYLKMDFASYFGDLGIDFNTGYQASF